MKAFLVPIPWSTPDIENSFLSHLNNKSAVDSSLGTPPSSPEYHVGTYMTLMSSTASVMSSTRAPGKQLPVY